MTGRPASEGSSSISTDAKNASMSTCRMLGRRVPSATERETAKSLGKESTGAPTLLLCPAPDGLAGPPAGLGKLRAMTLDRGGLAVDRVGHVDPLVWFER